MNEANHSVRVQRIHVTANISWHVLLSVDKVGHGTNMDVVLSMTGKAMTEAGINKVLYCYGYRTKQGIILLWIPDIKTIVSVFIPGR